MNEIILKGKISFREILNQLFEHAKERKLTQKQVAQETGVAESIISNYRKNKSGMTADNLEKVINRILEE